MWARSSVRTEHRTFTQKTMQRNPVVAGSIPVGPAKNLRRLLHMYVLKVFLDCSKKCF